jgi:hypothetical protein
MNSSTGTLVMRHRTLLAVFLWGALVSGALAMPAAVLVGAEDGPMPADQLLRKKAFARSVLLTGGGVAVASACGLYAISRPDRRRAKPGALDPSRGPGFKNAAP